MRPNWKEALGSLDDCGVEQVMAPMFIEPCLPTISRTVPTGPQWAYDMRSNTTVFAFSLSVMASMCVSTRVAATTGASACPPLPRHCWPYRCARSCSMVKASSVARMGSPSSIACGCALAARARPRLSCTLSTCWSLTVAICATSDGRVGVLHWCSSLQSRCGIRLCGHIEDVDGEVVFWQACVMGLEGIVAKRRDSRYRSGRSREWIKIKNPAHPAIERTMLIALEQTRVAVTNKDADFRL